MRSGVFSARTPPRIASRVTSRAASHHLAGEGGSGSGSGRSGMDSMLPQLWERVFLDRCLGDRAK